MQGLYACEFQRPDRKIPPTSSAAQDKLPQLAKPLEASLVEYFKTGLLDWDLTTLDWSGVTDFQQSVLRACYDIPAGSTLTYGRLAAVVGSPKAARAVGAAMARNRWPIVIPCHRVVGATGSLTGYSGNGGLTTKRKLLDLESKQEMLLAEIS